VLLVSFLLGSELALNCIIAIAFVSSAFWFTLHSKTCTHFSLGTSAVELKLSYSLQNGPSLRSITFH